MATVELDEIRQILLATAQQQAENAKAIAALREQQAADNAALRQSITEGFEQSRQRIEATASDVVEMISSLGHQVAETQAVANSNARAIQAWEQRADQIETEAEESTSQLQVDVRNLGQWIQSLIAERREDWRAWRETWQERQQESDRRFENLLSDAREDRRRNEEKHLAATENFQVLLLEIAKLWQRMAG